MINNRSEKLAILIKQNKMVIASSTIFVLVFALFYPILSHDFVNFDDNIYITENPFIQKGLTLTTIYWAFTTMYANFWHPLTWISHLTDIQLFGLNPGRHHLTNLLFHGANSTLVFLVFSRITGTFWRSTFLALLFAVHPLHVESVAWASERKDVLSTFFWFTTIWFYSAYVKKPNIKNYSLMTVNFILGMMAKPMLIVLPFALLLLDIWPLKRIDGETARYLRQARTLIVEKTPLFLIAFGLTAVAYLAQNNGGAIGSLDSYPLQSRIANGILSYVTYIEKTIWPHDLTVYYPYPEQFSPLHVGAALTFLIVITFATIREYKKRPYLIIGWLWFLGTLVPLIGLVQLGSHAMADRYSYISNLGLFIMLIWGVGDWTKHALWKKPIALSMAGLSLCGLTLMSTKQIRVWESSETLFRHALSVTTDNIKAYNNLGNAMLVQKRFDEAINYFTAGKKLRPQSAQFNYNLGLSFLCQESYSEAQNLFEKALQKRPNLFVAQRELSSTYLQLKQPKLAIPLLKQMLATQPNNIKILNRLGSALLTINQTEQAIQVYETATKAANNSYVSYYNLGRALFAAKKMEPAALAYAESLRIQPRSPKSHNNLGNTLSQLGRQQEALAHYAEAVRHKPDFVFAYYNMGITFKKLNQRDEAIAAFSQVLKLSPQNQKALRHLQQLNAGPDRERDSQ